jgi:hypothetical protein
VREFLSKFCALSSEFEAFEHGRIPFLLKSVEERRDRGEGGSARRSSRGRRSYVAKRIELYVSTR